MKKSSQLISLPISMVGRGIAGSPLNGPGTRPFGYDPDKEWRPVPEIARDQLPSVEETMAEGDVRSHRVNPQTGKGETDGSI